MLQPKDFRIWTFHRRWPSINGIWTSSRPRPPKKTRCWPCTTGPQPRKQDLGHSQVATPYGARRVEKTRRIVLRPPWHIADIHLAKVVAPIKPNLLPVGSRNYSGRFADFWFCENTTTNLSIAKPSPSKLYVAPCTSQYRPDTQSFGSTTR